MCIRRNSSSMKSRCKLHGRYKGSACPKCLPGVDFSREKGTSDSVELPVEVRAVCAIHGVELGRFGGCSACTRLARDPFGPYPDGPLGW
jgi:hypothetical protein